jgi:hypothetical protein
MTKKVLSSAFSTLTGEFVLGERGGVITIIGQKPNSSVHGK